MSDTHYPLDQGPIPTSENESKTPSLSPLQLNKSDSLTAIDDAILSTPASPEYIYVAGNLRVHFPSKGLEKEYEAAAQNLGINPRDFNQVFTYKNQDEYFEYRYIAEQVSWILSVSGQDVYVLLPSSADELDEFIDSLAFDSASNLADDTYSVAIGRKGPNAPKEMSDDKPLSMVLCHHLYHFTTEQLQNELSLGNTTTIAISNVLNALIKQPNTGESDFDRAKNFIAFRYPSIYASSQSNKKTCHGSSQNEDEQFLENLNLQYSNVAPGRTIVDIILTYQKNISGRQISYYASVDVTDQFPFLHSNLTDYIPTN